MFTSLNEICEKVKRSDAPKALAVVCAENETVLRAVQMAVDDGAIKPLLFGQTSKIQAILRTIGIDPDRYETVDCETDQIAAFKAVEAVREGRADVILKGDMHTSTLMKAALNRETGIKQSKCLTNVCMLEIPKYPKLLAISDGAILLEPTLEQKADMIVSISERMHRMGYETVKVSVLAASEEVSEKQQETLDAATLKEMCAEGKFPSYVAVDGPLAFDLSVDPVAAEKKHYHSEVAGSADLIIVHNIVVANAVCKALRVFAGAETANLVLGAKVPMVLTSRGASASSKYFSILVAVASA